MHQKSKHYPYLNKWDGVFVMKNKNKLIALAIVLSLILCLAYFTLTTSALSKMGSSGSEVTRIQTRLKNWGYYTGSVDGIYGSKTKQAVESFQRKNGLTADGIAGPATLKAMGLPAGTASASSNASNSNLDLLARVIHGEARGESYTGMVAVGAVVLNRVDDSRFPKTIAGVIYQPGAFDAVSDGQINLKPSTQAYNAARDALNGWDPTYGCVYYWNPATATSSWIWSRTIKVTIGKHVFGV